MIYLLLPPKNRLLIDILQINTRKKTGQFGQINRRNNLELLSDLLVLSKFI